MDLSEVIDWTPKDPLIKPERNDIIVISGERGGVQYQGFSNLLDFYFHRNHVNYEQYRAGCRLYRLWFYSCLRERYAACKYGNEPKSDIDHHDMAIKPMEYISAKMSINNPFARIATLTVICESKSPGRRKMGMVHEGLNDLIKHFA